MIKGNIANFSLIPGFVIVFREIFISGLREYYAASNSNSTIDVSYLGKMKTAVQMLSLFLILCSPIMPQLNISIMNIGLIILWIAMILSIVSGYQYFKRIFN